jgi:hypothetical protein
MGIGFYVWAARLDFFGAGSCGVLRGILRKTGVLRWFFDGVNVVECMVNVVFWQSLFRGEKCARFLGFISGFPFWE